MGVGAGEVVAEALGGREGRIKSMYPDVIKEHTQRKTRPRVETLNLTNGSWN